jgi:allophanate hydrolase subunit 1
MMGQVQMAQEVNAQKIPCLLDVEAAHRNVLIRFCALQRADHVLQMALYG